MNNPGNLVFIGAHPDDETFGVGGTLAHYSRLGYRTTYICATRGEAGEAAANFREKYPSMGELRWAELMCAAAELKLSEVHYLGYRDSGMAGSEANRHPQALINAPPDEIAEKMVRHLRRIKPEVVVTFDPIGGYRHPDHIATHQAAVQAFHASGNPAEYPAAGPAFQPARLFYHVFPHSLMKLAVKVLPYLGKDPHKFGKNRDIDLTQMVQPEFPVHAAVKLSRQDLRARKKATACHASQLGDTSPRSGIFGLVFLLSSLASGLTGEKDYYMQAYPAPEKKRKRRSDLFDGI
ncbi:MAG TPA: PIG-L family deacetylase [Dehalococcoidales bacterium]|nr:PIG-L family deacetylase [Dehalococcoidales bacterium]